MSDSDVLYSLDDEGIATITLNRPEKRNAFTKEMLGSVANHISAAQDSDDVRVVVLTGAGEAFCSGGDVTLMAAANDPVNAKRDLFEIVQRVPRALAALDKPSIAMIPGVAVGAGLDIALACDMRFASKTAQMSEGYLDVGLVAGEGGAYFLPRLVGRAKALELLLSARPVSGEEAERIGMVNAAFAPTDLVEKTYSFARTLASKPAFATRVMKRLVLESSNVDLHTALELASSQVAILQSHEDHFSAVAAFKDRRSARGGSTN